MSIQSYVYLMKFQERLTNKVGNSLHDQVSDEPIVYKALIVCSSIVQEDMSIKYHPDEFKEIDSSFYLFYVE